MTLSIGDTLRKTHPENSAVLVPYTDEGHIEFEIVDPGKYEYRDDNPVLVGVVLKVVK